MTHDDDVVSPSGIGSSSPLPAASVILLRGSPLEVLLLRRNDSSGFVPGAWIFPGGALDDDDMRLARAIVPDDPVPTAMRICAIRETLEEAGVWLGAPACGEASGLRDALDSGARRLGPADISPTLENLVLTSRWVTPEGLSRRYDTWFFLARAPEACEVRIDGMEGVEARWMTPRAALEAHRAGNLKLVFPTIRNLAALADTDDPEALLEARRGVEIPVTRPVMIEREGRRSIVVPGEDR